MSTAATSSTSRAFDVSGTRRVPFSRLVQVEMRKMADTRAGSWLLGIVVLASVAVVLGVFFLGEQTRTFVTFMSATSTPQMLLVPVLGILLVTGEWGQRTTLTTFTLEPSRMRVMAAKAIAAVLYALLALVITAVVAALAALVGGAADPWQDLSIAYLVNTTLVQVVGVLQGVAFGALVLNSAGAIVLFFVVPVVVNLVSTFWEAVAQHVRWIDLAKAQVPLFDTLWLSGEQWAQLASTSALWILLPALVGLARISRMELK